MLPKYERYYTVLILIMDYGTRWNDRNRYERTGGRRDLHLKHSLAPYSLRVTTKKHLQRN